MKIADQDGVEGDDSMFRTFGLSCPLTMMQRIHTHTSTLTSYNKTRHGTSFLLYRSCNITFYSPYLQALSVHCSLLCSVSHSFSVYQSSQLCIRNAHKIKSTSFTRSRRYIYNSTSQNIVIQVVIFL